VSPFRRRERIFSKQKPWGKNSDIRNAEGNKLTTLEESNIVAYPVPQVVFTLGHYVVKTNDSEKYDMQINPVTIV